KLSGIGKDATPSACSCSVPAGAWIVTAHKPDSCLPDASPPVEPAPVYLPKLVASPLPLPPPPVPPVPAGPVGPLSPVGPAGPVGPTPPPPVPPRPSAQRGPALPPVP